jgi:hypothetical protein
MATANTVVVDALSVVGVNSPTASQKKEAFRFFQDLISNVSAEKLTVHSNTEDTKTLTASTGSYTYGTGGDIDSARPVSIVSAFIRDTNGDDTDIEIISEARYDSIGDKDVEGLPTQIFYDAAYPLGVVNFYLVPDLSTYTVHLKVRKEIATLTALSNSISLPKEYLRYLRTALIIEIAPLYGYSPTAEDYNALRESRKNVKLVNTRVIERKAPSELNF